MTKKQIIEKAEAILTLYGFTQQDYIVSLQGPTIILSISGTEKNARKPKERIIKHRNTYPVNC